MWRSWAVTVPLQSRWNALEGRFSALGMGGGYCEENALALKMPAQLQGYGVRSQPERNIAPEAQCKLYFLAQA